VFVAIGHVPLSGIVKELGVKTNDHGEIVIDRDARTNVQGIFAAGDVVDTKFKQAITGAAEAVTATYSAYRYVKENDAGA
ncbi:MAG: FAD-dependent oxidoreductase, partial [Candidatus Aenigmarchaeota archaeon]|nr:FAD-dependent oxidoreductase [Candidatus Aenigmarchaeota archaeon]